MTSLTLGNRTFSEVAPHIELFMQKKKETRNFVISKREKSRKRMIDMVASMTNHQFLGERSVNRRSFQDGVFRMSKRSSSVANLNLKKLKKFNAKKLRTAIPDMIKKFNKTDNIVKKSKKAMVSEKFFLSIFSLI